MDLRTKLAVAITVGVIAALTVVAWTWSQAESEPTRLVEPQEASIDSPLRDDPPDSAWNSERSRPMLELNPDLHATKTHTEIILDCRRPSEEQRVFDQTGSAVVRLGVDGSSTLWVSSGDGYWFVDFEIPLRPNLQRGDALEVHFVEMSCTSFDETSEVHGWIALSELPTKLGQTIHFELGTSVSPNRCYRAEGSAKVEQAVSESPPALTR
ncbi:MAG: hypothetical protein HUU28_01150 [Planctomycetaceae bacterium]|nr:hypothetical protein [Planctomycetaceae bacterium]